MYLIFFIVSFIASITGAICGIGGGVIIKPTLDLLELANVSVINFLSGCTVLTMSTYSIISSRVKKESKIDKQTSFPLAIGAVAGGIIGKQLFTSIKANFDNANTIGAVQAVCLLMITVGALIYTINKDKINTYNIRRFLPSVLIGLALGLVSTFLGIGGGPINLVVLYFFFSQKTKIAAQNSLYVIFFSQTASLISTIATSTVPTVELPDLIFMLLGGLLGGIIGRKINNKIRSSTVNKLFIVCMLIIISSSIYNTIKYINF